MARTDRREFLLTRRTALSLAAAIPLLGQKGRVFSSEVQRYQDPSTEFDVYRLTSPGVSSYLPAPYQRAVSRRSTFLLYAGDRSGTLQLFRLDLKTGESKQLTDATALDRNSITLLPTERSCLYFDGPALRETLLSEREIYRVPEGWERTEGFALTDDGTHAVFAERKENKSRLRRLSLAPKVPPATVLETEGLITTPLPRPKRAQILYCKDDALWLVNLDGQQNRKLKTESAEGGVFWTPGGRTIVYLHIPAGSGELNSLREMTPDENSDKLLAKTSQFSSFGQNGDASVFVGASRNKASQTILLLLRVTRREFTLCEHRSTDPASVHPIFSPDSQSIYFQSDREGKPAIYRMRVEKLVEETN